MAENLKKFRHAVSVLKNQGLIESRIDARSAYPKWKSGGKKLSSLISKYDDIVSGKLTAVKVPEEKVKEFRKAGFETVKGRVLVPHTSVEQVRYDPKTGGIVRTHPRGIETVSIPVEFHNLEQYLKDMLKERKKINRLKQPNESFGFKLYGYNSSALFSNIQLLIDELQHYQSVIEAGRNRVKGGMVYHHFEIVRVGRMADWEFPAERKQREKRAKSKTARRKAEKRYKERHPKEAAKANREKQRRYRQRLKKNKRKYAQYKRKARERAKKSRG